MSQATPDDMREQEARIRQLLADALLKELDSLKRAQDIRFAPLTIIASSIAATAALFGAAVALLKWVG